VLSVVLDELFDGILMCEVLEHIKNDFATIERLANWLVPGGRLILSTPTASYGTLAGDSISAVEDGGHVRVGYDGPELDAMFAEVGLLPIRRFFLGHRLVRAQIWLDRRLRSHASTMLFGIPFSLACRPWMPWLDAIPGRPVCQVTIAIKQHPRSGDVAVGSPSMPGPRHCND
jgi:hypothetical protein